MSIKINIYKITNLINGWVYYGQTVKTIEQRFKGHSYSALKPSVHSHLGRAIRKYNKKNFRIEQLCYCKSSVTADREERYLISVARKNGEKLYNVANGGRSNRGHCWTKKQRKKLSDYYKHMPLAVKVLRAKQISKARVGIRPSIQGRKNISNGKIGKPWSQKQRMCLHIAHMRHTYRHVVENKRGGKRVTMGVARRFARISRLMKRKFYNECIL